MDRTSLPSAALARGPKGRPHETDRAAESAKRSDATQETPAAGAASAPPAPTLRLNLEERDVMHALAYSYLQYGQPERALALMLVLSRQFPRHIDILKTLAHALLANEQPGPALQALERIATLEPLSDGSPLQLMRARALLALDRRDQAERCFAAYVGAQAG